MVLHMTDRGRGRPSMNWILTLRRVVSNTYLLCTLSQNQVQCLRCTGDSINDDLGRLRSRAAGELCVSGTL